MTLPINYDDDLILYSEDGVTWLRYRAWLAFVYANHPERLRESPSAPVAPASAVLARDPEQQIGFWQTGEETKGATA